MKHLGIDFGTTHSAVAAASDSGQVELLRFPGPSGPAGTMRSIMWFHPEARDRSRRPVAFTGWEAIEASLAAHGDGRLIQSVKSFLASKLFNSTQVFHANYTLEQLVAVIASRLAHDARQAFPDAAPAVVVGRPVHFVRDGGADDDALAERRLRRALELAGLEQVTFEYEPVAAAYHYESTLNHDETILIADFGGGTSDFCLIRVGPTRRAGRMANAILGTEGVGLAGDAFDGRIVRRLVAPKLGLGSTFTSPFGRALPMPAWVYTHLERWHHLSMLKSPATLTSLREIESQSNDQEAVSALLHVVESDLGFRLYRAVEQVKIALSSSDEATFVFHEAPVHIEAQLTRRDFESWIEPELGELSACIDRLLQRADIEAHAVDRVFMTGGTSLVPAVRRVFVDRFGDEKVVAGDELTSVARGLALRAKELG